MEGVVVLLIFVVVMSALRAAANQQRKGGRPVPRRPTAARPDDAARPTSIRDLLEEFRRSMEEAERKARGEDAAVLQPPTPVEAPRLKTRLPAKRLPAKRRPAESAAEPAEVDFDEEAEAVIDQRRQWAEERTKALTDADHDAFDARLRAEASKGKAGTGPPAAAPGRRPDLRQLMIWREVLGPPVAFRDDGE